MSDLHSKMRVMADRVEALRPVFGAKSKYLEFFNEYLDVNKFELALHAVAISSRAYNTFS
jgi:hypothetical protein